ncbi:MAG TPA: D-alanyl-D-alanine carboxypeptidase/D-alanyl-D-alanine-endopeptidase [Albitalea sp.]|nr:D-alanyl-D-alanine carboxypeptidase/D-alanyl-D-alanine-endopeptidase [Albitalea sp.]
MAALLFVVHAGAAARALPAEVEAALQRAKVPRDAMVAVVQEVDARRPRLAWQPQRPVNPASLFKLVTTDAALELLGPGWTWSTPVWLQGAVHDGVLDGNLVIKGSGDPKLVHERVWLMLRRVRQLGVSEIRGDIVLDRSAFSVPEQNPGDFDGEALRPYNVRPDALLLNFRSVLFTFTPDVPAGVAHISTEPPLAGVALDTQVPLSPLPCGDWRGALRADFSDPARLHFGGSFPLACGEKQWPVAPADPAHFNERMLQGVWREMGGRLGGTVRDGTAPDGPPTFQLSSPSLAELVRDINKFSNNTMAQQLFLSLALTLRGQGTPDAARALLHDWLAERFGAAGSAAVIDNGSGLSRDTRVSAELLADLLRAAWASPVMPELMSSLPVAGIDGTLRRSNTALGRAHLKTGSLRDVTGIAGYVLSDRGRRYVLVAVINHPNAGAAAPALDALLQWTANDSTRESKTTTP